MKIVSYSLDGAARYGLLRGEDIVDLSAKRGGACPSLASALAAGVLDELAREAADDRPIARFADVRLLPVVPDPQRILCVGLNYHSHRLETGRSETEHPSIFIRLSSSQTGHEQPIRRPRVSDALDFEGELAVVIGRGGRYIAKDAALEHVAGYACYNDATLRDWQRHTHQFTPGKNFPETGAFGPWMVTADEIPDPGALSLTTRLNGTVVQRAELSDLIFPVPELIAYVSSFTELAPGDVIATGTPGGVGFKRTPPLYMKPGDVVEVEVSGIGILRNPIADETAP